MTAILKNAFHAPLHGRNIDLSGSGSQEVHDSRDDSCNKDPEKLEPVKERHPNELWLAEVVERRIKQDNKGHDEQDE